MRTTKVDLSLVRLVTLLLTAIVPGRAVLTTTFYDTTCPNLTYIVTDIVGDAITTEPRMGASLLRLHFHDCFVNGCDGSLLLDDTDTFTGEKHSLGNNNSVRGFEVIDAIKLELENQCPETVSCADILAIAAEVSVLQLGGPSWDVFYGRRDSLTASIDDANTFLPSPFANVSTLRANFVAVGLDTDEDLVALSGGHTFGKARCSTFGTRIDGTEGSPPIDSEFNTTLNDICSAGGDTLVDLDQTTPNAFDLGYFSNLVVDRGVLISDQVLLSEGGSTADYVENYAASQDAFFVAFVSSMIRMGNLNPLEGTDGEIRTKCRVVNPVSLVATM